MYAGGFDLQNHFFPFFRSSMNANDRKKKNAYDYPKQIASTKLYWPVIKSQYITDKSTFQPWTTNLRFATALMRLATSMTKSSMLTGSSGTQILMKVQNFSPNFVELVLNLQKKCQKINGFILKVFQRRRKRYKNVSSETETSKLELRREEATWRRIVSRGACTVWFKWISFLNLLEIFGTIPFFRTRLHANDTTARCDMTS